MKDSLGAVSSLHNTYVTSVIDTTFTAIHSLSDVGLRLGLLKW